VTDAMGRTIVDKSLQEKAGKKFYTMSNAQSGVYFLSVSNENEVVFREKIVVK